MNLAGLAVDKGPAIENPLGFFYLMPLSLLLAGALLAWQGDAAALSRWSPLALAVTHLLVLGVLTAVMCGALLKIAPVLLGASRPVGMPTARLVWLLLGSGSVSLAGGFFWLLPSLLLFGACAVAAALLAFAVALLFSLRGASGDAQGLRSARLALLALALTVALGATLAMAHVGWIELPARPRWVDLHAAWGLAGWMGLLGVGVALQLTPMFYVTPPFSALLRRWHAVVVIAVLLVSTLSLLRGWPIPDSYFQAVLLAVYAVTGLYALYIEQRRQRPRRDPTLWLWQVSHGLLPLALVSLLLQGSAGLVGAAVLGALLCFVTGALLKIVPFLNWLDLQQRRAARRSMAVKLPQLRQLMPDRYVNAATVLTMAAVSTGLLGMAVWPWLLRLCGVLMLSSGVALCAGLYTAARIRRRTVALIEHPSAEPRMGS